MCEYWRLLAVTINVKVIYKRSIFSQRDTLHSANKMKIEGNTTNRTAKPLSKLPFFLFLHNAHTNKVKQQ